MTCEPERPPRPERTEWALLPGGLTSPSTAFTAFTAYRVCGSAALRLCGSAALRLQNPDIDDRGLYSSTEWCHSASSQQSNRRNSGGRRCSISIEFNATAFVTDPPSTRLVKVTRMVTKFKQMTSILGAAFTLIASNAFGQSFDFKGLVLGAHVDARTLEEQHHLTCRTASAQSASPQARSCAGQTTFLGMPGTEKVLVNGQGIVTQIDVVYSTTTVWPKDIAAECRRRLNIEPPCRPNIEPGVEADF